MYDSDAERIYIEAITEWNDTNDGKFNAAILARDMFYAGWVARGEQSEEDSRDA